MTENGSILVTGAAGQLGAVGRTATGLLLDRGLAVRATVRREDDRAAALRAAGDERPGIRVASRGRAPRPSTVTVHHVELL